MWDGGAEAARRGSEEACCAESLQWKIERNGVAQGTVVLCDCIADLEVVCPVLAKMYGDVGFDVAELGRHIDYLGDPLGSKEDWAGDESIFDVVSVIELAGFAGTSAEASGIAQPSHGRGRGESRTFFVKPRGISKHRGQDLLGLNEALGMGPVVERADEVTSQCAQNGAERHALRAGQIDQEKRLAVDPGWQVEVAHGPGIAFARADGRALEVIEGHKEREAVERRPGAVRVGPPNAA